MELDSGWQIGIRRTNDVESTEQEEREAMTWAGLIPEEHVDVGVWIAAIPNEWARAAQAELRGEPVDDSETEGKIIQSCLAHAITGQDGRVWIVEVPLP